MEIQSSQLDDLNLDNHKKLHFITYLCPYLVESMDKVAREHRPHSAIVAESAVITPVKKIKPPLLIFLMFTAISKNLSS